MRLLEKTLDQQAQSRSAWFRGERLQLVREFHGLTQKELGERLGISHALVSDFEKAKRLPAEGLLETIADRTGFLPSFFLSKIDDPFLETECSFRHRRSTPERMKSQVRAHATVLGMVVTSLRRIVRFPEFNVPSIPGTTTEDIENAAKATREHWGMGLQAPINQVGRALERAGVIIIPGLADTTKIDAFSRFGENSLIFLNRAVNSRPSRWNFDLAHECGHLVLHRDMPTGSVETELAADAFASAFLMPREAFSREFKSQFFSWSHVFEMKKRWHTSAAAIVRRAKDLNLISDQTYRRAFQYMSFKQWRNVGEPFEPDFQEPELFEQALQHLAVSRKHKMADLLGTVGITNKLFLELVGTARNLQNADAKVLRFPAS